MLLLRSWARFGLTYGMVDFGHIDFPMEKRYTGFFIKFAACDLKNGTGIHKQFTENTCT